MQKYDLYLRSAAMTSRPLKLFRSEMANDLHRGQIRTPDFAKRGGLIFVIIQDVSSMSFHRVLGHGHMNEEAYRLTLATGELWLWSTSRQELWHKGATSNGICRVSRLELDCDGDCLLAVVEVQGSHQYCCKKQESCFSTHAFRSEDL
jgi:phosphoribosyl-AMP cyclohydrolase